MVRLVNSGLERSRLWVRGQESEEGEENFLMSEPLQIIIIV